MIGHLPSFGTEELLYSVLARWAARSRIRGRRSAMLDLSGRSGALAVVDLPANLDALVRTLPAGCRVQASELINKHTLFPYYEPFLPTERAKIIRAELRGAGGSSLHARIGLMAGRLRAPAFLRYCPGCDAQDLTQEPGLRWRRVHQLPGVEVCPVHEVFLECGVGTRRSQRPRHGFIDPAAARGCAPLRRVDRSDSAHTLLLRLACGAAYLLARGSNPEPIAAEWLHDQYARLLCAKDLATCRGGLRINAIRRQFAARYPVALLSGLQCELANGWLERLLRRPRGVQSPLRHLLMWDFLGFEAALFLTAEPSLFGPPPFPCLNPVCPQRGMLVIAKLHVEHHHTRGVPVAAMLCPVCGYDYRRLGPDLDGSRRWQAPDWVADYGPLWRERLRRLWASLNVSLREMTRTLGVDPITVKRQAAKLGLDFPRSGTWVITKGRAIYEAKPPPPRQGRGYSSEPRKQWLVLTGNHPHEGRKQLRSRASALWTTLYRSDRVWLDANSPPRRLPRASVSGVDWSERDGQLYMKIDLAAQQILTLQTPPTRLTFAAIARKMEAAALLQKCPHRFPATIRRMEELTESREQFALRRIELVLRGCLSRGEAPARWHLAKLAGLRPELCALASVARALDTAIYHLNRSKATKTVTARLVA